MGMEYKTSWKEGILFDVYAEYVDADNSRTLMSVPDILPLGQYASTGWRFEEYPGLSAFKLVAGVRLLLEYCQWMEEIKVPSKTQIRLCMHSNGRTYQVEVSISPSFLLIAILSRNFSNLKALTSCHFAVCPSTGSAPTFSPSRFTHLTKSFTYSTSSSRTLWNALPYPFLCTRSLYSCLISSVLGSRAFPEYMAAIAMAWNSNRVKVAP